jgi:hypothetical protein
MNNTLGHPAIAYFREHPRVIKALMESGLFTVSSTGRAAGATSLLGLEELRTIEAKVSSFNLFEAIGVAEAEVRHSRMIAWLLDPKGSHELGDAPLHALRQACEAASGQRWSGARKDWQQVEVRTEQGGVDVTLRNAQTRCVVLIENKVHAGEHGEQLTRYRSAMEQDLPGWTCLPIFLTLRGDLPSDGFYSAVSYRKWVQQFAQVTAPKESEAELAKAVLLHDYVELIEKGPGNLGELNLFKLLNLAKTELKHSHFIAWLLNPRAEHGWGTAFAEFLFKLLAERGLKPPRGEMPNSWEDVVVYREREHVDVLVVSERHRVALVIENKIGAAESADQLDDYNRFLERHYQGDWLVRVFLDFKGRTATHPDFLSLSYADLLPFFAERLRVLATPRLEPSAKARLLVQHYLQLLENKLWLRVKTRIELPGELQAACKRLADRAGNAIGGVLGEIRAWQKSVGKGLEPFLYAEVDALFGPGYHFTYKIWYSFVPPVFDGMAALRREGRDPAFGGRALIYQFFVIPFGEKASVRKPGIVLDVKLLKVSAEFESTKARLLQSALLVPEFNRTRNSAKVPKFAPVLSYELISATEAIICDEAELKKRIRNRLRRFHDSLHPILVEFFKRELKAGR